jgi:hypothetical protein
MRMQLSKLNTSQTLRKYERFVKKKQTKDNSKFLLMAALFCLLFALSNPEKAAQSKRKSRLLKTRIIAVFQEIKLQLV